MSSANPQKPSNARPYYPSDIEGQIAVLNRRLLQMQSEHEPIHLTRSQQLRVYRQEHEGRQLIHVRVFRRGDKSPSYPDGWYPTRQGVSLTPELATEVGRRLQDEAIA